MGVTCIIREWETSQYDAKVPQRMLMYKRVGNLDMEVKNSQKNVDVQNAFLIMVLKSTERQSENGLVEGP